MLIEIFKLIRIKCLKVDSMCMHVHGIANYCEYQYLVLVF